MKILYIVQQHKRTIFDRLQESVVRNAGDCELLRLSDAEQKNLKQYFIDHVDVTKYDRVLLMIRMKTLLKQIRFLQTLPNLAHLEIDAWQNYHAKSKYRGQFSKYYRGVPWARIISSGYQVTQRLCSEGLDVAFVAKGYDQALIENLHKPRTIELGFIGSLKAGFYSDRRDFLQALAAVEPLQVMRTKPGRDYVEKMNQIRFFISADVNFGEYMIKNFEAMAAGCVLCAFDQGGAENAAIGLRDMENIVLYKSLGDLRAKLAILRADTALADSIAAAGQEYAQQHCTFDEWGKKVVEALRPPLRDRATFPQASAGLLGWMKRLISA
jgi:hypothetical protein